MPVTRLPYGLEAFPLIGSSLPDFFQTTPQANPKDPIGGNIYFVDGDNGSDGQDGHSPDTALKTIGQGISLAGPGGSIYVKARNIPATGTDPVNYAEVLTIPNTLPGLKIIGCGNGRDQTAQPQIKKGSGAVALLTVRAPGCLIYGLTINGAGSTGGGILLDDNGTTKVASGTIIDNCVFKNCVGSGATDSSTGGAVQIGVGGGCWDSTIKHCSFYKNIGGFVLLGTGGAIPQDILIEDCLFHTDVSTDVDTYLWGNAGSGIIDLIVRNCEFGFFPSGNTKNNFMDLTKCTGQLVGNRFASNGKTFGAAANVLVPTTVFMAQNYQEKTGAVSGEIFRT